MPISTAKRLKTRYGPVRKELLSEERIQRMATEMQKYLLERTRAIQTRVSEAPKELQDITARIARLRERLRNGDPDMDADEIQAAIDKAEGKRRELERQLPEARQSAKVLSIVAKAAALYRAQIAKGSMVMHERLVKLVWC